MPITKLCASVCRVGVLWVGSLSLPSDFAGLRHSRTCEYACDITAHAHASAFDERNRGNISLWPCRTFGHSGMDESLSRSARRMRRDLKKHCLLHNPQDYHRTVVEPHFPAHPDAECDMLAMEMCAQRFRRRSIAATKRASRNVSEHAFDEDSMKMPRLRTRTYGMHWSLSHARRMPKSAAHIY